MNINYKHMKIDNGSKILVHFCDMSGCKEENQVLMDICKNKGISYIGVDLPGQGEAEIIANIDKPQMVYMAKLATIHFNQINCDEIIVSGHSMGAAIALMVAANSYDKVSRIILESPATPAMLSTDGARENLEAIISKISNQKKYINGQIETVPMDEKTKLFYQDLGKDFASEKFIKEIKKVMSKVSDKRIDVLFGANDPIIPCNESIKLLKRIGKPNIIGYVLEDAKHSPHNENEKEYREILNRIL